MKKVGVVILNWNGKSHLETYLPSVVQNSDLHSILVIDNNSSDNSVEFLSSNYPKIRIIQNTENGGFAKGYNDGLKQIENEFDYYILLNSDIEVTKNWIDPIIEIMEEDKKIAACQPKILSHTNKKMLEHAGASGGFLDINGYPFCRGRIFDKVEEDTNQYDSIEEVFWATGACMFVQSNIFHKLNGFDEDYFAHMEEIDLCWRMKLHGYKIIVNPNSHVFHLGGGTLDYMNPRKIYLNFRNSLFTLMKNYRGNFLIFKIKWRFILDYLAILNFVLSGNFRFSYQVIRAHFHFISSFRKMYKKRSQLLKETKNIEENKKGRYRKSIVFSRFFKKKTRFSDLNPLFFNTK